MDKEVKTWDKTAKNYFSEVVSPFAEGVDNPIFWYLDHKIVVDKKKMSVMDMGCGIGNFLPTLSKKFAKVVGFDFSPKMVDISKDKVKNLKNVTVLVRDARDLSEFYNQFDAVVTVNSILLPNIRDIEKMFKEAYNVLKQGGVLLGIFPAMESFLYQALLIQEKYLDNGETQEEALKKAQAAIDEAPCDFAAGLVKYKDSVQKNYYLFELKHRLWKAGFSNIVVRKVYYPWEVYEEEELLAFRGRKKLWDWFVYAEK